MIQVRVVRSQCIGAASCVAIAPNTFQLDDENISEVVSQIGDTDDIKLSAAKACPVNAIIVEEVDENGTVVKQLWPPIG